MLSVDRILLISLVDQCLVLVQNGEPVFSAQISSGKAGNGERKNSGKTPRGRHQIRAKIGAKQPINMAFKGRRPVGIFDPLNDNLEEDWILSRILWLSGLEVGLNRLGDVDTMQRYIYIHGTPDQFAMGVAESHGCIRMRNQDVMDLFERVCVGSIVMIEERSMPDMLENYLKGVYA